MKIEDFTGLGLNEDLAKKCLEVAKNELEKDVEKEISKKIKEDKLIPKDRFDEVNNTKKLLEENLKERDKQLESLKKGNLDIETLKETITTLQEENKQKESEYQAELTKIKLETALDLAISSFKGKNAKAIKALLDLENATILDDGKIKGLENQLKELSKAEDSSFLFEQKEEQKSTPTGFKPAESGNKTVGAMTKDEFRKLPTMERLKFAKENKEQYAQMYENNN